MNDEHQIMSTPIHQLPYKQMKFDAKQKKKKHPPCSPKHTLKPIKKRNFKSINHVNDQSYLEILGTKRRDFFKLTIFTFIVIAALGFHSFIKFLLENISIDQALSYKQVLLLKLFYPSIVFAMLWFIKSIIIK